MKGDKKSSRIVESKEIQNSGSEKGLASIIENGEKSSNNRAEESFRKQIQDFGSDKCFEK